MSEWVLLNANSAIFQLYHGEKKLIFNEMIMRSALYQINTLSSVFQCQLTETTVHGQTFCNTWIHYPDSKPSSFGLSHYYCVLRGEATNTHFIVFGFTKSELEPTIYSTGDEHDNHYTIDVVRLPIQRGCYLMRPICSLWFDLLRARTHDTPHSRRTLSPLHHRCGCQCQW